jgi:hypothetical protein
MDALQGVRLEEKRKWPLATLDERMKTLMRFFGFTHKQRPKELSANALAAYIGMTHPPVVKWMRGDLTVDLVDVCDKLGVSFDWIVGRSSHMWSESFEETRTLLTAEVARRDWSRLTTSLRVGDALRVGRVIDPVVFTPRLLASIMGISLEAAQTVFLGERPVSRLNLKRLSEWTGIPLEWFTA